MLRTANSPVVEARVSETDFFGTELRSGRRTILHSKVLQAALAIIATLLAVGINMPDLDRYATIDESLWVGRSADFALAIQHHEFEKTLITGHPGVTTMWLGALGLDPDRRTAFSYLQRKTEAAHEEGYLEALVSVRRVMVAMNAITLGSLVWLVWGLFGPGVSALAGLLLILDPFVAAHSRFVHLDALLAGFMSLAVLAGLAFWSGRTWGYLLACGAFTGLALLSKAPAAYLLVFIPLLAALSCARSNSWSKASHWFRLMVELAIYIGLTGIVMLLLWPALWTGPVYVLDQVAEFVQATGGQPHEGSDFFLGQPVADPGWLFYPIALLFRATPLMLIGLGSLLYAAIRRRHSHGRLVFLLACYAIGFVLMMTLSPKKGDRYILPIFPFLDVLASLGLWLAWSDVRRRVPAPTPMLTVPLVALLIAVAVFPRVSTDPYYLAYYNPLLGGGPAARWTMDIGLGEGLEQAAAYLNSVSTVSEPPLVATTYDGVLQAYLERGQAVGLDQARKADYIVMYVNRLQRRNYPDWLDDYMIEHEPVHVVRINGIEYARLYAGPASHPEAASNAVGMGS